MEHERHQPHGGEQQPERPAVNSYGTDDPEEQARIEQARREAHEQRQRDRQEWERYVAAGINEEDAEGLVEFKHYAREQRGQAAQQQAELHTEDSPAEREIRIGLYQARMEGRTVDDATARRIAAELQGEQGSALDGFASSGAIHRDQVLREIAAYQVEPSWRVHWIDALTRYVLDRGERGPVPDWDELAAEEPGHEVESQADTVEASQAERDVGPERSRRSAPRIYVVDLASYNQGILHGLWIDANRDVDELQADIEAMLASSPTVGAEEYAIHDYEGFAGVEVGEHEDLAVVSRVARGIAEHGAAYAVYAQLVGTEDGELLEKFDDFYVGSYASPEAWARDVGDDLEWERHLNQVVDPMLRPYLTIDYARFARDQRHSWDVMQGIDGKTHVFMR